MKLQDNYLNYDGHIDKECVELCNALNNIPYVTTFESCCGHGKDVYKIWFECYDIGVLSRLSRAVSPNYSDGNWEIICDSTDTDPFGIFELRTTKILGEDLMKSVHNLMENIVYWFDDRFDNYFRIDTCTEDYDKSLSEDYMKSLYNVHNKFIKENDYKLLKILT